MSPFSLWRWLLSFTAWKPEGLKDFDWDRVCCLVNCCSLCVYSSPQPFLALADILLQVRTIPKVTHKLDIFFFIFLPKVKFIPLYTWCKDLFRLTTSVSVQVANVLCLNLDCSTLQVVMTVIKYIPQVLTAYIQIICYQNSSAFWSVALWYV